MFSDAFKFMDVMDPKLTHVQHLDNNTKKAEISRKYTLLNLFNIEAMIK